MVDLAENNILITGSVSALVSGAPSNQDFRPVDEIVHYYSSSMP